MATLWRLVSLGAEVATVFVLVPILTVIAYRLLFNPLAGHPGPFVARVTDYWAVYHAWKGDLAQTLDKLHSEHGAFVRFGPRSISCNTVEALEGIYGFKANTRKSRFYHTFAVESANPSTHTVIDKTQHARKRRLVSQGLSTKATKELEPHVLESIDILAQQILSGPDGQDNDWNEAKDMAAWASYLTIDVMGAMTFSKRFGLMETPEHRWIKDAIPIAARNKYATGFMPWIIRSGFDTVIWPSLTAMRLNLGAFAKEQLQQRILRKHDESLTDLFRFILKAEDTETGESLTEQELVSEAALMISAGGDTTSTAIAATFYYLTEHVDVLQTVTKEVRDRFGSLDSIRSGAELSSCTYLRACIDETMRLSPPAPSPLMREALAGGVHIDGHTFPEGTDLAVSAFVIHRNHDYYLEPLSFQPERWLSTDQDTPDDVIRLARAAFCPFSIGSRNCVGRGMAYLELTTALARILWSLDLRRKPGDSTGRDHDGTYRLVDSFVAEKFGPMVEFRRRAEI